MLAKFVKTAPDKVARIKEERINKNLNHSANDENDKRADDDLQTPTTAKNIYSTPASSETPTQFLNKLRSPSIISKQNELRPTAYGLQGEKPLSLPAQEPLPFHKAFDRA